MIGSISLAIEWISYRATRDWLFASGVCCCGSGLLLIAVVRDCPRFDSAASPAAAGTNGEQRPSVQVQCPQHRDQPLPTYLPTCLPTLPLLYYTWPRTPSVAPSCDVRPTKQISTLGPVIAPRYSLSGG
ncbi:uncharacterized protein K460DRAFT_88200 [Cucurbitaria berberidis CBS 394.84]|uniref:Uncharacterized protein n=1 Tax=Cucurbitaria berberidis CBS 394.84 TaxID=1168544 RepID=A0A9P4GQ54_9PLEO|nr:uncharacterized protein K460DRAFT_88200 [Cucurbitaria berberidis CBS 394.84]KAF1849282.1 hypothetical protein K460DRAFT_88200 [Cucurbitaria berberidis CBS 394.84]